MINIERSIIIGRPRQEVFDFVSDPANASKWRSTIKSSKWITPAPIGVGAKSQQTSQGLLASMANITEVTVWEPPDRIAQRIVEGGMGGSFQHTFEFLSQPGGTTFTVKIEMEPGGILRLLSGMVVRQTGKMVEAELKTLKDLLEGN